MQWLELLTTLLVVATTSASKVLVVVPLPARSHVSLFEPLVEELARRGHQVTYVKSEMMKFKKSIENVEELLLPPPARNDGEPNFFAFENFTVVHNVVLMPIGIRQLIEHTLKSDQFQKLLNENRQYDVIVAEAFLSESIAAGLAHKFKAPLVGYGTFMPGIWVNYMVGNEAPSSYAPDPLAILPSRMTFLQRMYSFIFNIVANRWHQWSHLGAHDEIMRRYFGKDLPYVGDIIRNTSVLLVNDHYSISFPRPAVPNIISIGGIHVKPPRPLPNDLKKILDESKKGVILFSLGSNLKSSLMDPMKLQLFLNVFEKLEQNILWKFEEDLPNKPNNVITSAWLPQSDILAHPNLKLFITHGGLLSTIEAMERGVPIVGIPVFGDQPMNMIQAVNAGVGLYQDFGAITEESLLNTIREVLHNQRYAQAAKERSQAMKDVMEKPLNVAAWWVEYVIRNKGAPLLRSAGQDLTWYQRDNIDVILTLAIIAYILVRVAACLIALSRKVCSTKKTNQEKRNKKD